ncbi:MAG: NADP-dependent malic enzyme [Firmicutes bacterium]|nr:NADP-dependent malic enzyme [[Eubacterium] siraeum]MCM1488527.1 NADP-dependent malic enzyme [Bacillota bacterium]
MDVKEEALKKHYEWQGKIEVVSRATINTKEDLSLAYTPGVAEPCLQIQNDPELSYSLTRRSNLVAVITDGTAVLGLGDIGGLAGMPVMEGKCCLFKEFAGVDAFPLCVKSKDVDEIVHTVELISDSFGGINLEDISAPRCFEIERKLKERLDIPVFHDDQHGTAVVVGAALINAAKCAGKPVSELTVVINGAGAAGIAIGTFLLDLGIKDLIMVDLCGIINRDDKYENPAHSEMALRSNRTVKKGGLAEAAKGADVLIGVSKPGLFTEDMIRSMAEKPIVFAMANPTPEIMPDKAKEAGAYIVGTGRSDFPNQINNVLVFPGLFKGALSVRAREINEDMKLAAAYAIASVIPDNEINPENIIASPLNKAVADSVAQAAAKAWTDKNK